MLGMKKRQRRGKPRHPAVVAADMQPPARLVTRLPIAAASYPSGAPNKVTARGRWPERPNDFGEPVMPLFGGIGRGPASSPREGGCGAQAKCHLTLDPLSQGDDMEMAAHVSGKCC